MAISDINLRDGLLEVLDEQGLDVVQLYLAGHYYLRDDADGTGLTLEVWNEAVCGPLPDETTIQAKAIQRRDRLSAESTEKVRLAQVETDAKTSIATLPGWATWTETEALAWMDANIESQIQTNYPNTYLLLTNLVKLTLAMRNKIWPDLEGG